MNPRKFLLIMAVFFLLWSGCDTASPDSSTEPSRNPDLTYEGWWMAYADLTLFGHDGDPHSGDNFVVYSDACPQAEKQRVAEILELLLVDLMNLLHIESRDEFAYTTTDRKFHIYLSMYLRFPWGGGFMDVDTRGFMLYAMDSPLHFWPDEAYDMVLKHELMHLVNNLLAGGVLGDAWFIEGIAENVSNLSGQLTPITGAAQLQDWLDRQQGRPYGGNPVSIHTYADVLESDPDATALWDPCFELAARYLLDPEGHGRTWLDVKRVFLDLRTGHTFAQAFANHMGMTLAHYEANFFTLMFAYLE